MKNTKEDMLNGSIAGSILKFFFPIMLGSIFQTLYNTVDAMIVGNFVGKEALGAVGGSTGTIINLMVGFIVGLSGGATVVIAQYFGNNEPEGVHKGVDAGMFLAFFMGSLMMIIGLVFAPSILHATNVPADVYPLSLTYIRIYFCGMLPTLIYNNGSAILRAVGDSRKPFIFLIIASVLNIILDTLFVAVLRIGVAGAAIATVISQTVSCILVLRVLATTKELYCFRIQDFHLDLNVLKRIILIGLPVGIQSSLYGFANLFIQAGVNSYGTDVVAAYTAFNKLDSLFWNASGAMGQAILTFCGQNFGAGNIQRVRKGIRTGVVMYIIGSATISLIIIGGGPVLYRLFTDDLSVIELGIRMSNFLAPFWAAFCFVEIMSSGIRACGDSLMPAVMTALGIGALRIGWILLYPAETIFGTLVIYPISWVLTSVLFLGYYLQGGWLKRSMHQREKLMDAA